MVFVPSAPPCPLCTPCLLSAHLMYMEYLSVQLLRGCVRQFLSCTPGDNFRAHGWHSLVPDVAQASFSRGRLCRPSHILHWDSSLQTGFRFLDQDRVGRHEQARR